MTIPINHNEKLKALLDNKRYDSRKGAEIIRLWLGNVDRRLDDLEIRIALGILLIQESPELAKLPAEVEKVVDLVTDIAGALGNVDKRLDDLESRIVNK